MKGKPVILQESPILQSTAKSGKAKYWQGRAEQKGNEFFYVKRWWQEGAKIQESKPVLVKGKNSGKANATTDKEQVLAELASIVQKQRDKGYSEDGSNMHIPIKPMLAQKYKDKKHTVVFPCWAQPKLDGFRMLKDGKQAWTRGGKPHVMACVEHLIWDTGLVVIDGELILPGPYEPMKLAEEEDPDKVIYRPVLLQKTAAAAKKFDPKISPTLQYWVYDIVSDQPFETRMEMLVQLAKTAPENVRVVMTRLIHNADELQIFYEKCLEMGFEGTMIRSGQIGYEIGHRSNSLLKLKPTQDAEFLVIDVEDGKGSFEGKAIFVCRTESGQVFRVVPEGNMDYRAKLYQTRTQHIGKQLTVRYQNLSADGVPVFPIGVTLRDPND